MFKCICTIICVKLCNKTEHMMNFTIYIQWSFSCKWHAINNNNKKNWTWIYFECSRIIRFEVTGNYLFELNKKNSKKKTNPG